MVIILIFLSLLLTVLLRFRFINNSLFFRVLRRPFPAGFILFLLSSIIHLMIQKDYSPFSGNIYSVIIRSGISVITLWFFLFFFSSSMLRTPVTGLYLTPFISSLRIDIHPQYITRPSVKVSSIINADKLVGNIEHFILCYPSYNTITLQSHILRHGIRNRIANNLKKKGILYKEKARKTPLCETIVLNLRYGGKTRYRLFSCRRHPNGFRVHRNGGAFIIQTQNN